MKRAEAGPIPPSPWLELRDPSFLALSRSLQNLASIQEEYEVPVAVENMGSWEVCHFRDPSFLPVLSESGLSFCLDVGHAFLNGVLEEFLALGRPFMSTSMTMTVLATATWRLVKEASITPD